MRALYTHPGSARLDFFVAHLWLPNTPSAVLLLVRSRGRCTCGSPQYDRSAAVGLILSGISNLNRGDLEGHRILQVSTHDLMWKPAHQLGGPADSRAAVGISWWLDV